MANKMTPGRLQILFDGPPGPVCGRFIEAERDGRSIKAGTWIEREGGLWALEIEPEAAAPEMLDRMTEIRVVLGAILDAVDYSSGACRPVEMVGAVLPEELITRARDAIAKAEGR